MNISILSMGAAGAIIASVSASAASASSKAQIPFELDSGHIFVGTFVNGHGPYRFGFDTGASGIGRIDAKLRADLSLPAAGAAQASDGVTTVAVDKVTVQSLRLGNVEKKGVSLISRDYNKGRSPAAAPIMGIIGRDFFAEKLVTIDYPAKTIVFSEAALRATDPGVVAYGPSFSIAVCFASGCYPAKIDTGSSRSIVLPKSVAEKVSASAPVLVGQVSRTNGTSSLYEMQLKEPIRIAGIAMPVAKVLYADPSDEAINIGSDFLKDYVLTIDQRNHLLRIIKPKRK